MLIFLLRQHFWAAAFCSGEMYSWESQLLSAGGLENASARPREQLPDGYIKLADIKLAELIGRWEVGRDWESAGVGWVGNEVLRVRKIPEKGESRPTHW